MKKRILSLIMAVLMLASLLPTTAMADGEPAADENKAELVEKLEEPKEELKEEELPETPLLLGAAPEATELTSSMTYLQTGSYKVSSSLTMESTIQVVGEVKLTIAEGAVLTAASDSVWPGIIVSGNLTLDGAGTLITTGSDGENGGDGVKDESASSKDALAGGDGELGYPGIQISANASMTIGGAVTVNATGGDGGDGGKGCDGFYADLLYMELMCRLVYSQQSVPRQTSASSQQTKITRKYC